MLVPAVVLVLLGCGTNPTPRAERPFSAVPGLPAPSSTAASPTPNSTPVSPTPSQASGSPTPGSTPAPRSTLTPTTDIHTLGDLPGWKHVFVEDFTAGDVPLGAFPGPLYSERWDAGYKDGTPDTAGQLSSGRSGYYPTEVLSVQNGLLDWFLHTENGISKGAAPTPKIPNASKNPPRANSLMYGRYSVRFKADSLAGFKVAWLLWPDSGVWPRDGEIDFPEGELTRTIYGATHAGTNFAEVYDSGKPFTSWHVATTEWTPERLEFFLDGRSLGASTTEVPSTPMHFILQTESCLTGCPAPETQGHVYLDWISIWVPE